MGFDRADLLQATGYTTGEFIPIGPASQSASDQATTSANFVGFNSQQTNIEFRVDNLYEGDVTPAVYGTGNFDKTGSGATVRIFDFRNGQTLLEKTGVTTTDRFDLGPSSFTPSDSSIISGFTYQFKSDDGTSTVELSSGGLIFGVVPE